MLYKGFPYAVMKNTGIGKEIWQRCGFFIASGAFVFKKDDFY